MRGRFITIEGSEGAGKSTNLQVICTSLDAHGIRYVSTREPGGTPAAEALRDIMLKDWQEAIDPLTELLIVFAARQQHLEEHIWPHLADGTWVVCDRFTDATFAYQGYGRGVAQERIAALEDWVHGDLQPDLTIYLDVAPDISHARIADRPQDRMEKSGAEFFARVRGGYLARAAADARYRVIDAGRDLEDVQADVASCVTEFIEQQ